MVSRPKLGFFELKVWLKNRFKQIRLAYLRRFRSFDARDIEKTLRNVGIKAGDVVFVHSAYNAFEGFSGKPTNVIAALETAVGPDGTLMMPSMPFTGTALDYIAQSKSTDIRRTPSRMGILTEVLRRQKGTWRSLHPTHPVLAKGRLAEQLTTGHEQAATPCGDNSPFAKLPKVGAKILFLGTSIETMTFFHYLEEAYEAKLPASPFTSETVQTRVKDGDRSEIVTMRLFDPNLSRKRRIARMWPRLEQCESTRFAKVGTLTISVIAAVDAEQVFQEMIEQGESLYDA